MSTFRIYFTQTASASVAIEADTFDEAVDLAYEELPGDICAQCGGWGSDYTIDLDGEWLLDETEHERDGELVRSEA